MFRTTAFRTGASALGASGLIALALAAPASARQDPGPGGLPERPSQSPLPRTPTSQTYFVDDNAMEYLQIGGGVLAGLALAGAGMALASRRTHAHPHPA